MAWPGEAERALFGGGDFAEDAGSLQAWEAAHPGAPRGPGRVPPPVPAVRPGGTPRENFSSRRNRRRSRPAPPAGPDSFQAGPSEPGGDAELQLQYVKVFLLFVITVLLAVTLLKAGRAAAEVSASLRLLVAAEAGRRPA